MTSLQIKMLKNRYRTGKITACEIWNMVDAGDLTEAQATMICGPRPA
ncbi:MAG: hypothetical protein IJ210_15295 [Clostridia bacterium]|nr:hypothetical protein [Clostridia bacterium]